MNNTIELLANNRIINYDNWIEYNPKSYKVRLVRRRHNNELFGYEEYNKVEEKEIKAVIIINSNKAFLNSIGVFFENELPVLAYFKNSDDVRRGDEIIFEVYGKKYHMQVTDILTIGYFNNYVYKLSYMRDDK